MKVLLKQVYITDPASPYQHSRKDIFIAEGVIRQIADAITETADHTVQQDNLYVSPGWADPFAHFCDPGQEYRETLASGAAAAAASADRHIVSWSAEVRQTPVRF